MTNSSKQQTPQQAPGILACWYATPLNQQQALSLKQRAETRHQLAIKRGKTSRIAILMELIADFWLTGEISPQLESLESPASPLQKTAHGRLLAQTISGQLLISRQLEGGLERLQQSFQLAAPLLKADDYFLLMERYKVFETVPLLGKPQSAKSLEELLNLGGVIEKLQDGIPKQMSHDPNDLYG